MRLRVVERACHGGNLERFIRPLLLAHLARNPEGRHGYAFLADVALAQTLTPAPSGVYRALRSLEDESMVEGHTDHGSEGPARRVYRLTEGGRSCLAVWATTLREYADEVRKVAELCEGSR